jgi:hypothetical protein
MRLLVGQRHVWAYLHLLLKNDTLTSDICWTINAITSHYSYKSCENVGNIFQFMFPDSLIDQTFPYAERKSSYLATFCDFIKRKC